jgi:hypothetical protein
MTNRNLNSASAGALAHVILILLLLFVECSANAESGDALCAGLYMKSGAIQGTSTCYANAWGNTPINLSNHYCVNEPARIKRWCGAPPTSLNPKPLARLLIQ